MENSAASSAPLILASRLRGPEAPSNRIRALWRTLEQWMQAKGLGTCARQLLKNVAGIKSMDVLLPVKRGEQTTELRLRVVATPEPATAQLLAHLGLRLPKGPKEISNVVPKTGG